MEVFSATANQIAFLFLLITIGFGLTKAGLIKSEAANTLGKIESTLLMPAVILKSLMENFTVSKIAPLSTLFFAGVVTVASVIAVSLVVGKYFSKDYFLRNSYIYGLCFSNGGYMGNAVMLALFPDVFFEYIIFTLPMTVMTYMWGVPVLLAKEDGEKQGLKKRLKSFINPMCMAVVIGIALGLLQVPIPMFAERTISALADCMSPIAMLLIGIAVANAGLKKVFTIPRLYIVTSLRLLVFPLITSAIIYLLKPPQSVIVCSVCWMAMPLGLNPLIMASAYGKDTTENAGMVIVSHLLSFLTIPMILTIVNHML